MCVLKQGVRCAQGMSPGSSLVASKTTSNALCVVGKCNDSETNGRRNKEKERES